MQLRAANRTDIPALHEVRMAVRENVLSHRDRIREADYLSALEELGCGWLVEDDGEVLGFAIAYRSGSIWALFVHPDHEGRGVAKALHAAMLEWLQQQTVTTAFLSTEPGTRAEAFYRSRGWQSCGPPVLGEMQFELALPQTS